MKDEIFEILKISGMIFAIGIATVFMFLLTGKFIDVDMPKRSFHYSHGKKHWGNRQKVYY